MSQYLRYQRSSYPARVRCIHAHSRAAERINAARKCSGPVCRGRNDQDQCVTRVLSRFRHKGAQMAKVNPHKFQSNHLIYWRRGSESNRRRRLCRPLHDHSATPPGGIAQRKKTARRRKLRGRALALPRDSGAGKESRTPDLNLGKVALYQLSYSRVGQRQIIAHRIVVSKLEASHVVEIHGLDVRLAGHCGGR